MNMASYAPASPILLSKQNDTDSLITTVSDSGSREKDSVSTITSQHSPAIYTAVVAHLGLMAALGAVGNTGVVVTVIRMAQLQRTTYILIANLSVTGLFVSVVCIPAHLVHLLGEGEPFPWEHTGLLCKAQAFLNFAVFMATPINSAAIAVCRYKAVVAKHSTRLYVDTRKRIWKILCFMWILPLLLALTASPFVGYNTKIVDCFFSNVDGAFWYLTVALSGPTIVSLACMLTLYVLILKKVRDSHTKVMNMQHKPHSKGETEDRQATESCVSSQGSYIEGGTTGIKIITTMDNSCSNIPSTSSNQHYHQATTSHTETKHSGALKDKNSQASARSKETDIATMETLKPSTSYQSKKQTEREEKPEASTSIQPLKPEVATEARNNTSFTSVGSSLSTATDTQGSQFLTPVMTSNKPNKVTPSLSGSKSTPATGAQSRNIQHLSPPGLRGVPQEVSVTSIESSSMSVIGASKPNNAKGSRRLKKEIRLMIHLFTVFALFCIFFLPFNVVQLLNAVHQVSDDKWLIMYVLAMSFSSNAWLLYALTNKDFRLAFKALLSRRRGF